MILWRVYVSVCVCTDYCIVLMRTMMKICQLCVVGLLRIGVVGCSCVCVCANMCVCMCVCMYMCVSICVYVCALNVCVCVCVANQE